MKQAHLPILSALLCVLVASAISAAMSNEENLLFFDISKPLVCEVEYGRRVSKVILGQFIDESTRSIELISPRGNIFKSVSAHCEFSESDYSCRWGKGHQLRVNLIDVNYSHLSQKKMAYVSGAIDIDVFRPSAGVTCQLETLSLESSTSEQN